MKYGDCNIHQKINFKSWFSDTFLLEGAKIVNADTNYHKAATVAPRKEGTWSYN